MKIPLLIASLLLVLCFGSKYCYGQQPRLILQEPHIAGIDYVYYNHPLDLLYSVNLSENLIKVWNVKYNKLVKDINLPLKHSSYFYLLPHGQSFIAYDNNILRLYSAAGLHLADYDFGDNVNEVMVDNFTGNIALSKSSKRELKILDTKSGKFIPVLQPTCDTDIISYHSFNSHGLLAYNDKDKGYIISMADGRFLDSISFPKREFSSSPDVALFCNENGTQLAMAGSRDLVIVSGKKHDTISSMKLPYSQLFLNEGSFSPKLDKYLYSSHDSMFVLNTSTGEAEARIFKGRNSFHIYDFLTDSLVQLNFIPYNEVYNIYTHKSLIRISGDDDVCHLTGRSVKYSLSPDNSELYSQQKDTLSITSTISGATIFKCAARPERGIKGICINNNFLYLCGSDQFNNTGLICQYKLGPLKYIQDIPEKLAKEFQAIEKISFEPGGAFKITGSNTSDKILNFTTGLVDIVNLSDSEMDAKNRGLMDETNGAFLTNVSSCSLGKMMATAKDTKQIGASGPNNIVIEIKEAITNKIVQTIQFAISVAEPRKMSFSNDGLCLALATNWGIMVWKKKNERFETFYTDTVGLDFTYPDFCFDSTSEHIYYITSQKLLKGVSLANPALVVANDHLQGFPQKIACAKDKIAILEQGKLVEILNKIDLHNELSFLNIDRQDWMIILPDGNYYGCKNATKSTGFCLWPKYYAFDQFDAAFNRPDKVLEAMGCKDIGLINAYKEAYNKRIKRLGIDSKSVTNNLDAPVVTLMNTQEIPSESADRSLKLKWQANDSVHKIVRYYISVNGMSVNGINGQELKPTQNAKGENTIQLSIGANKIQLSCMNDIGNESIRETFYVKYVPKGTAVSSSVYFIGIGADKYQDTSRNLRYSAKDIRDLAAVILSKYPDAVIDTLINEQVTSERILRLQAKLSKTNIDDEVIVAFSGHGLLDAKKNFYCATYGVNFAHPEQAGLPYEDLSGLLNDIPARKKLLLIDACHSGEIDADGPQNRPSFAQKSGKKPVPGRRGGEVEDAGLGTSAQSSFELMKSVFADLTRTNGAVVISASGGYEYALEDNQYNNGIFTYCIIQALVGHKAGTNGTVTVGQLQDYVSKTVEDLTGGQQKPTARQENLENDWVVW